MPYVLHDNRTFIGNDWQYTSGNSPRISQTAGSYYMRPTQQTQMSYREPQEYQEYSGFQVYPVPFPHDRGVPDYQPSQRVPPPQPRPIDTNPPPYQYFEGQYPHYGQVRAPPAHRRGIYKRRQPPVPESDMAIRSQASQNRGRVAVASEPRAMGGRGVLEPVPAPVPMRNEPSRKHFNTLMSRLRTFSTDQSQENTVQSFSHPPSTRRGDYGSVMAPQPEVMLSGKELFEKAKREDKTGKYNNCYWDDRMDCFVNRAAGDVGPFWKRGTWSG